MIKMVLSYMTQVKKNSIGKKVKHTGKTSITLQKKKKSEFHSNYTTKI